MSATLDTFFGSPATAPQSTSAAEPHCFKCHRTIPAGETIFTLPVKGKLEQHCRVCAKKILQPQENAEESI